MTYLALARRERPQRFADVVGQAHVVRTLQNAIRSDRVHHAFLFCGTRGVGKTSTARILAKALNCEQGPAEEPCNRCAVCEEITTGASTDVIEIDAATHRGVEEAQRFLDGVQYRPVRYRYKFYIVDEVHMMTRHAFNALLKTFEEPPPHVKFVLATTEAHQVPDTILSRCQRFDFRELGASDIDRRLAEILDGEGVSLSARARSWIVREARGSMRDSQSLLDQVLAFAGGGDVADEDVRLVLGGVEVELVEDTLGALAERASDRVLASVAEVAARGHDLRSFVGALLDGLRECMVAKAAPGATFLRDDEETRRHLALLAETSLEDVVRWVDLLLRCQADLQRSEEPRLTLETALIRATTQAPIVPFGRLIEQLGDLERRLGGSEPPPAGPGGRAGPATRGGAAGARSATPAPARSAATTRAESDPAGRRAATREPGAEETQGAPGKASLVEAPSPPARPETIPAGTPADTAGGDAPRAPASAAGPPPAGDAAGLQRASTGGVRGRAEDGTVSLAPSVPGTDAEPPTSSARGARSPDVRDAGEHRPAPPPEVQRSADGPRPRAPTESSEERGGDRPARPRSDDAAEDPDAWRDRLAHAPMAEPPGAAPAAPPATPVERFLAALRVDHPRIARWVERGNAVTLEGDSTLVIGVPAIVVEQLTAADDRAALEAVATAVLGPGCALRVVASGAGRRPGPRDASGGAAPTPARATPRPQAASREVKEKVLADPFVQKALELFGGEIVEVNVLGPESEDATGGSRSPLVTGPTRRRRGEAR